MSKHYWSVRREFCASKLYQSVSLLCMNKSPTYQGASFSTRLRSFTQYLPISFISANPSRHWRAVSQLTRPDCNVSCYRESRDPRRNSVNTSRFPSIVQARVDTLANVPTRIEPGSKTLDPRNSAGNRAHLRAFRMCIGI